MATERCIELLLESKDFGALDTNAQANRLAHFMSDWFNQDHKLDTVDHVRLTARLRTHASKMRISAGEVMEILLPIARKLHAQSVYEQAAARLRDEDQSALEPVYISHPDASNEPVEENVEATPVEATHMDTPEPAQEPVHVRQTRSRSRARPTTAR
jgi:hypothetical protein